MAEYIRYVIKNTEPLRIADDSTSQNGQTTTLRYIPGSTIRGLVINALAKKENFEQIKRELFSSHVRYLNAYPIKGETELFPSPKGFYEDKTETEGKKRLQNLVAMGDEEKDGGMKRASLGRYCYFKDDCIHYCNVDTDSDMKIKINDDDSSVFRNEYIVPGHYFVGYIAVEGSIKEEIKRIFHGQIILGNARSSGIGKCQVQCCDDYETLPYGEYQPEQGEEGSCYMILLSNTVMRGEHGEYCGLNLKALEKQMGVTELQIDKCSTSTVDVKGYNRKWGGKIPSVVMYEQGSVFRLVYQGTFQEKAMQNLADRGIGIRRNEGFGRVLFLKDYDDIHYKQEIREEKKLPFSCGEEENQQEDDRVLKTVAKSYYRNLLFHAVNRYVVKHPIKRDRTSNSQLGQLEAIASACLYDAGEGIRQLNAYLEHAGDKDANNNTQKQRNSIYHLGKFVSKILKDDIEEILEISTREKGEIMGIDKKEILNKEERQRIRLHLLIQLIRYDNKREDC